MRFLNFCILFLTFITIVACDTNGTIESRNIIARVHDEYLYEEDIEDIVSKNASAKDSLTIVKNFINNWIRQKLVIKHAEANLPADQKDFSEQLEQYRNSLIMYQYETMLIQQTLDTIISEEEIENYYLINKSNFELKETIIKVDFIKFYKDSPYKTFVLRHFNAYLKDEYAIDSLNYYCTNYAIDFDINNNKWILFDDLLRIIPIQTYNKELFLQKNNSIEVSDELYIYAVNILEYSIKDGVSPLSFERANIKQMILNRRKIELINKMQNDIFQNAFNQEEVEIY